jgi:DNA-binding response OmpR family regulator
MFEHCSSMKQDQQILLISDDQEKATVLHGVLTEYHPKVSVNIVEKFQQSDIAFGKQLPALIILLVTDEENSHMTWLKKIRVAKKLNEIPVFSYNELPGKNEMQELIKTMQQDN